MFSILDEELRVPNGSDEGALRKLLQQYGGKGGKVAWECVLGTAGMLGSRYMAIFITCHVFNSTVCHESLSLFYHTHTLNIGW